MSGNDKSLCQETTRVYVKQKVKSLCQETSRVYVRKRQEFMSGYDKSLCHGNNKSLHQEMTRVYVRKQQEFMSGAKIFFVRKGQEIMSGTKKIVYDRIRQELM